MPLMGGLGLNRFLSHRYTARYIHQRNVKSLGPVVRPIDVDE